MFIDGPYEEHQLEILRPYILTGLSAVLLCLNYNLEHILCFFQIAALAESLFCSVGFTPDHDLHFRLDRVGW